MAMEPMRHFDIHHKLASEEALQNWRSSTLVLNASRRFRYVRDLTRRKKLQQMKQFKIVGVVTQASLRFITAGKADGPNAIEMKSLAMSHGFPVDCLTLAAMVEKGDMQKLRRFQNVRGIAHKLKVNIEEGLNGLLTGEKSELAVRQKVFGSNTYPEKPPKGFWRFVWEATQDLTLRTLAVCACVSLGVGLATEGWNEGWYDGAGVVFSIILVVFVTAASDYQQSLQFRDLDQEKKKIFIQVTRSGRRNKVLMYDLVVGDIVHLSTGDQIPADGLLIEGFELSIDESSMTGESRHVRKGVDKPFLLSGTTVQDGSGLMLVTGVGMNTEWGHLMATLGHEGVDRETPLQVKLNGLATLIGKIGLGFALVTFMVLLGRFLFEKYTGGHIAAWGGEDAVAIINYFAIAVTIVVVAVPEGLPLAVTLTLAFAMKKMMLDKALVRHLAACETMGSATTICSDKTGTLTTNRMTVVKTWMAGSVRDRIEALQSELPQELQDVLLEGIFRNTTGAVAETSAENQPTLIGSPTETAVLGLGVALGGDFRKVCENFEIVKVKPFSSSRKKMGVVVRHQDGHLRAHWKGASEIVLALCDRIVDAEGRVVNLDKEIYDHLIATIAQFADNALRTLCLAYKDLDEEECDEVPENKFVCAAIIGIKDPIRPGVPAAVQLCVSAGIMVRMVTGDNIHTAKAIARECGILTNEEDNGMREFAKWQAVEGPDFRTWTDEEMTERIPHMQVMARSSPTDKYKLVKMLRHLGEVVAVTGDGTNDAPALNEADVGMAMGIAGTEVAKESADVIILDDNFGTIVVVAKWGRSVYNNIQKFVQFQLTVNLVALVINFTSACATGEAPLTAVQLLWVNLIMDTLGALALATEPPHDDLLKKKATGWKTDFITNIMWRNIFGQVVYQLIVLGVLQYKGLEYLNLEGSGEEVHIRLNTMIFNAFVFCQVFNEINAREMEKFNVFADTFQNWMFLSIIFFTVVFQWLMVTFLGKFASTVPLTGHEWLVTVGIGAISMLVAVVVKLIPVPATPFTAFFPFLKKGSVPIDANAYQPLSSEEPLD